MGVRRARRDCPTDQKYDRIMRSLIQTHPNPAREALEAISRDRSRRGRPRMIFGSLIIEKDESAELFLRAAAAAATNPPRCANHPSQLTDAPAINGARCRRAAFGSRAAR